MHITDSILICFRILDDNNEQVYLHDKYNSSKYKIYMNVISFIYNDIHVFVNAKDGAINIMSRSFEDGDYANYALHKMIINHINDLRKKPTLECPGVILEEHIMWPRYVEHPSMEDYKVY